MLKIIFFIVFILILLFFIECRRELGFFRTTRYELCVPKLAALSKEKRIVLLADLHNKVYGEDNEDLLNGIRRENPDLILIPGDMLISKGTGDYEIALAFVSKLPEICPVYYSLGNHEQRLKENPGKYEEYAYKEYKNKLLKAGVHILENKHTHVMLDQLCVSIYGLELPMSTYEKFKSHRLSAGDVANCTGNVNPDNFNILLAHNPVFFEAYKAWGADLTASGHLHGGIIRIPGLGGIISPQVELFPKYSGEMTVEGTQAIVVSKGLGTHTFNLRFCNYAEMVTIRLVPYR